MRTKGKGFTLIELLVVIAIIAILAAILFPVFASAKQKANQAKCMSNLRQVAMGFMFYVDSNNETWPTLYWTTEWRGGDWYPPFVGKTTNGWVDMVHPYVRNKRGVQLCPSNPTWFNGASWLPFKSANYMYNHHLGFTKVAASGYPSHPNVGQKCAAIKRSSRIVALSDGSTWDQGRSFDPGYDGHLLPEGAQGAKAGTAPQMRVVHNNGCNFIWCDGHVSWVHVNQMKPSMWYWDPRYTP